ncbi:hypothetical protein KsCSTR_17320 [Candidatus Kuenenia stuttgartiensis]|uniref:Uncharacterized protein n=1 Tax=Kuenenia stuttgartiensis TaxID=174633 RepID=A0A6G7GNU9_KUEST|nr:hypothetical protein KsCSTR_17320 [Candidatus Kuenenia stuttgartiensis]
MLHRLGQIGNFILFLDIHSLLFRKQVHLTKSVQHMEYLYICP